MLTLNNFETICPSGLLSKGRATYSAGAITALQESHPDEWTATVNGTTTYQVEVFLQQQEIIHSNCTCPFAGDTCKHQIAVYFAIRQEIQNNTSTQLTTATPSTLEQQFTAAHNAIAQQHVATATQLISDGIRTATEDNRPGIVYKWQQLALELAVATNDLTAIRRYAKLFAFTPQFNITSYQQWKNSFPTEEWPEVINTYINDHIGNTMSRFQQEKTQRWYSPIPLLLEQLAPIYLEEQYFDKLLALIRQETDILLIIPYHDQLLPHYPEELLATYLPALELMGDRSGSRTQFIQLAAIFEKLLTSMPQAQPALTALLQRLMQKYTRRPALLTALSQVADRYS